MHQRTSELWRNHYARMRRCLGSARESLHLQVFEWLKSATDSSHGCLSVDTVAADPESFQQDAVEMGQAAAAAP